jgi:tetratricopeptide (TPR) repeat protein
MKILLIYFLILKSSLDSLLELSIKRIEYGEKNLDYDSLIFAYKDIKYIASTRGTYLDFYFLAFSIYKLYTLKFKNFSKEEYIDTAIYFLEKANKINPKFSDGKALLASLYGMKAKGFYKGMIYGRKSDNAFKEAKEIDSLNPRVYYLEGISLLYKPSQFGGSKKKAISNFKKAIKLFEEGKGNIGLIRWGYLECMVFLGIAYEEVDSIEKAEETYKKVLKIEPEYGWAKSRLYNLKKNMK